MRPRYSAFYGISKIGVVTLSRVLFWRSVVGLEHWVRGPALIAANHASFLDPPLIGGSCPEQIAYVARKDLFRNVLFRKICYAVGAIPYERGGADVGSIKRVLATLRRGKKVLVFPEGIRTFDGRCRAAMPGIGFLVERAGVPVIPTYILGSYRAWPRHRLLPMPAKIVVAFGEPVRFGPLNAKRPRREAYQAIADEVMARIVVLEPLARAKL
jgi:1-acyl-sn-glycerol-3-phosphate acyltransferase